VSPAPSELTGTEATTLPHDDEHDEFADCSGTSHHLSHKRKKPPRSKGHGLMEFLPRLGLRGDAQGRPR
jgi:hypothetical protein